MIINRNIMDYCKSCNVDYKDMLKALQGDLFARQQFEEWKKENNR